MTSKAPGRGPTISRRVAHMVRPRLRPANGWSLRRDAGLEINPCAVSQYLDFGDRMDLPKRRAEELLRRATGLAISTDVRRMHGIEHEEAGDAHPRGVGLVPCVVR